MSPADWTRRPPGYLIVTAAGEKVLIDSGFPEAAIGVAHPFDLVVRPEHMVTHHLAQLNLTPADIDIVVSSHFDLDHACANHHFPDARHLVQRSHYEFATGPNGGRFDIYRDYWQRPEFSYELIDGDYDLAAGIRLIETSGHVPGHQSVMVDLPQTGRVFLAIDAIVATDQLNPETYQPNEADMDPVASAERQAHLRRFIEQEQVDLTLCGHDAKQWATLKKAPGYYD